MENTNTTATIEIAAGKQSLQATDLEAICGARLPQMPVVLRLLTENVARNMDGEERDAALAALLAWVDSGTSEAEIAFSRAAC
jgi:aconitate hydratase